MTRHKKVVNELLLYLHAEMGDRLRCWEIDTGQAYAIHTVMRALQTLLRTRSMYKAKRELRRLFYGKKGHPDITGLIDGRWFGIEVKIDEDVQNESQKNFEAMIHQFGGIYLIHHSSQPMEETLSCLTQALANSI